MLKKQEKMMQNIVHIAETAFMSILVSAIEAFPSKYEGSKKPKHSFPEGEVYGLLFGQRVNRNNTNIFNITIATPVQLSQMPKNQCSHRKIQ